MSSAVKESLHASVYFSGLVAFACEQLLDGLVDLRSFRAVAHQLKGGLLPAMDDIVHFAHGFAGAAFDNGAGDVAEVTCFL